MKANIFLFIAALFVAAALITATGGCSKNGDSAPAPPLTQAEMLVQGGKWITTGATLIAADGTSVTLAPNDPFIGTLLLADVTFYADGTAIDLSDPNGLTKDGLTWKLTGSNLLVNLNHNNTDKVSAVITSLSLYKLVMTVTDFYQYNNVTYVKLIQTLTH